MGAKRGRDREGVLDCPARVVLMEESPLNRRAFKAVLEAIGCVVSLVEDAEELVTIARAFDADLVLIHLHFAPWGSGAPEGARIRKALPWVRVVLYIAGGEESPGFAVAREIGLEDLIDDVSLFESKSLLKDYLAPLVVAARADRLARGGRVGRRQVIATRTSRLPARPDAVEAAVREALYRTAYREAEGNQADAARRLRIRTSTFKSRAKKFGIL